MCNNKKMNYVPNKNDQNAMKSMFNDIAKNYDFLNNIMTFFTQKLIKNSATNSLKSNHYKILDVCTGTGDIAIMLARKFPNASITALDFSLEMLKIAKTKSKNFNINYINGNAIDMPFSDNSFDLCTISFGLRNLPDITVAIREIHRVLDKNGELLIVDLGKPNIKWLYPLILDKVIPLLGKIFHKNKFPYQYLVESQKDFPSPQKLSKLLQSEGFAETKIRNFLFGTITALTAEKFK